MLSRNQVKHIHSLKQKKFREIHQQFLAEGSKLILEMLDSSYKLSAIYATAEWLTQNDSILISRKIPYTEISVPEMERITALSSPSPVLAVAEFPEIPIFASDIFNDLALVLDDIKDPGNLGTILRIADWFGIRFIICSMNTVDLYNPKVIQATMGSFTRVMVIYDNLPRFLSSFDGKTRIYGTFPEGENIYSGPLKTKGIIVIGNESEGISSEIAELVTDRISIPSYPPASGHDHAESLNASVATAIICSEFRRRTG